MQDATGLRLSPEDLHPRGACSRCGRIMVRPAAFKNRQRPSFLAVYGAQGMCKACHCVTYRAARAGRETPPVRVGAASVRAEKARRDAERAAQAANIVIPVHSRTEKFLSISDRGEARGIEANTAARDAYIAARRRRLARSQGRTLRAALSAGWGAL